MTKFLCACDDLLSPDLCEDLIHYFKGSSLELIDSGVALYNRGILHNAAWAQQLFERIKDMIPSEYRAVGCNECFRFSEYEPGGQFKMHRDGINQDSRGRRSVITVNIFLNDDFTGGSTDFYFDDRKTLRHSVEPKRGRAAVFDSQHCHLGQRVETGRKYLLRTDVMRDAISDLF